MANVGVVLDFRRIGKGHVLVCPLSGGSCRLKVLQLLPNVNGGIVICLGNSFYLKLNPCTILCIQTFFLQSLDFKRFEKLSFHVENIARTLYRD